MKQYYFTSYPKNFYMTTFTLHDKKSAPTDSQALLDASINTLSMVPNLHAVIAEAPGLLEGYQRLHQLFLDSSFDNKENTVVWQTINVEDACHYCVPAHTDIAKSMKIDDAITDALRNETTLPTACLETLRDFTFSVVRNRGEVDDSVVQAFLEAGFTKRQILEVILGAAQKVMSNCANHP